MLDFTRLAKDFQNPKQVEEGSLPEPSNATGSSYNLVKNLNGVIFDMDGTLVSTLPLIVHCLNEIVEKYLGRNLTLEEVISTFGLRRAKSSEDSLFNWEGFKAKLPSRTTTAAIDESYLVELSCSRGSKSYSENSRNLENAWQSLRELNAF